jgi:hypothetical protein
LTLAESVLDLSPPLIVESSADSLRTICPPLFIFLSAEWVQVSSSRMKSSIARKLAPTRKTLRKNTSGDSCLSNFQNTFQRKSESRILASYFKIAAVVFYKFVHPQKSKISARVTRLPPIFSDLRLFFVFGPILPGLTRQA